MLEFQANAVTNRILQVLMEGGGESYFGEPVTQLAHALQTAALAEAAGASDALIVAALLHDVGHLLGPDPQREIDGLHEVIGNQFLQRYFSLAVTEPVRMHVAAKRYLCTVDPAYAPSLSPASLDSLGMQGGAMNDQELREFEATPWSEDAAVLRRWDDAAKVPGLEVPGIAHYRERIERLLAAE